MELQTVQQNARIALEARLHVRGENWGLRPSLKMALESPAQYQVHLHYEDEKPVAVFLVKHSCAQLKPTNCLGVQMYVRRAYRRKGIASKLIQGFVDPHPRGKVRQMRATRGRPGSAEFWRKHDVRPWYCPKNMKKEDWHTEDFT